MYSMPIFFNTLTYSVRKYTKRKGEIVLQNKSEVFTSREVCIGKTMEDINNPKYNTYLKNRLESSYAKTYDSEVVFISVTPIVQCGYTTDRF